MLTWLDGRNGSSFQGVSWSGGVLTFGIAVGAGANGLQAMLPTSAAGGPLTSLTRGGVTVPFTRQTIKGIEYAVFAADPGTYQASYTPDTTPPVISSVSAVVGTNGTATVQWATNEPSTSLVQYGTAPGSLTLSASSPLLLTAHSVVLTGLTANTTYYYQVTSADAAGNSARSAVCSFLVTTVDTGPPTVTLVAPERRRAPVHGEPLHDPVDRHGRRRGHGDRCRRLRGRGHELHRRRRVHRPSRHGAELHLVEPRAPPRRRGGSA